MWPCPGRSILRCAGYSSVNKTAKHPEPKLLDVTLRDGGFCNGFSLSTETVSNVAQALGRSMADVVELGYVGGLPEDHGHFSQAGVTYDLCGPVLGELVRLVGRPCAVMIHPRHPRPVELDAIGASGISLVRVPIRPNSWQADLAIIREVTKVGLKVSANLILGSWWRPAVMGDAGRQAADYGASVIYLADTTSALEPSTVAQAMGELLSATDVRVGFHAHDGRGLALANSIAAMECGATWIDGSVFGIGRDAGNTPMEVLGTLHSAELASIQMQLTSSLPALRAFDLLDSPAVWQRICALLDLSPPCCRRLEDLARERRISRVEAGIRLSARSTSWPRPLSERDCCEALDAV